MEALEARRLLSANFPNFTDPAGLNLVGAAAATSDVLRLAPLSGGPGAAWLEEQQFVAFDFETAFEFQLGDGAGGPGGSDGFAFVIQASSDTALGGGGGNLGYANIPNSLAVEFDIFRNSNFNDPDASHVSVHTNGLGANRAEEAFSLGAFSTSGFDLDDGNVHTAKIVYQTVSDTLSIFLDNLLTPALSVSIDLPRTLDLDDGKAWVGFTAATGGGPTNHDILSWQYNSAADLSPVLAIADVTALEGSGGGSEEFDFTVTRIGDAATAASVEFTVTAGTAAADDDFVATSGSLSFPAGVIEQTITVNVNRDDVEEPHEEFFVTLSNPAEIGLGDARARGTILNDEATITIDDTRGREDDNSGLFREFVVEAPQFLNTGITFGPDGNLYVSRPRSDEILRFDGVTGESLGTFVSPGSGGVDVPAITGLHFGADGHLYVPSRDTDSVLRYDGTTGAFIDTFVTPGLGGLERPKGMVFGPDGHLYVGSAATDEVFKYDGTDGSLLGVFVTAGSGGLQEPRGLTFGPDGHLYVGDQFGDSVLRYDGSTGEFLDVFVPQGSGGLGNTSGLAFGPSGRLFVVSESSQQVLIYDSSGEFLETIVPSGESPLDRPRDLVFGPGGDLYVTDFNGVARFTVQPRLAFTVSLSQPVGQLVTVDYTTSDGTAAAGTDYVPTAGSLTFTPGETSQFAVVPLLVTSEVTPNKTVSVNLSNASPIVMLGDAQAIGTIVDQHAPAALVTAATPTPGSHTLPAATDVSATFDRPIDPASANSGSFVVHSRFRGQLGDASSTVSTSEQTVTLDPTLDFLPGELVQVTATGQLNSRTAGSAFPYVWQFRAAATTGTGLFEEAQQLGNLYSFGVGLGDLDGDGDLDAFVANGSPNGEGDLGNRVWLNAGGQFTDSGQILGDHNGRGVSLGDLDGDGDLDAFVATNDGNRVWRNLGDGRFVDSGQHFGDSSANSVELGDLDGDGDLDAVVAKSYQPTFLWLNDGGGNFQQGEALTIGSRAEDVALGDLDNDGDLDAFFAHAYFPGGHPNEIWFNDGSGKREDSVRLGGHASGGVALGDLDNDGDLDAFVANIRGGDRVWLNDGSGGFTDTGQVLGNGEGVDVSLGDVDADGDLDAVVANYFSGSGADLVWLNDGNGRFSDSGQALTNRPSTGIALGDLDGDGDLDIFSSNIGISRGEPNRVVFNVTPTSPLITLSRDVAEIAEDGGVAVYTVALAETTTVPVTVELAASGTATAGLDYTTGNLNLTIAPGETSVSTLVTALDDTIFDPDETVTLEIVNVVNATLLGLQRQTTIIADDEPLPPRVTAVSPAANSENAGLAANISATFEESINSESVTTDTFVVHTGGSGQLQAAEAVSSTTGPTITLDPATNFLPGELVSVTTTSAIESTAGPVLPYVWQFRAEVSGGSGLFEQTATIGDQDSFDVKLGDLDGDGDLDAFVANDFENRVWFNESGRLVDSGQLLGDGFSTAVELGDLDGDGDLDAFVANLRIGGRVWLNNDGIFADSGQRLGSDLTFDVALGDIDGDGDLDGLAVSPYSSRLWLNEAGQFTDSGQSLPGGFEATFADADDDGDLDLWLNLGSGLRQFRNERGQFASVGENLGGEGFSVALGDLDQDGDLDMFASVGGPLGNQVFLNEDGNFTDTGQRLGDHAPGSVTLGDLDGDGDLDAFIAGYEGGSRVWLNQGNGNFFTTDQTLGNAERINAVLGDLDGDGDLDLLTAGYGGIEVWENRDAPPGLAVTQFTPTSIGFTIDFNRPLDPSALNLYDVATQNAGPADVTLIGASTGEVAGSLMVDASGQGVTFIKSGSPLLADTYTVLLRSGADAFKSISGALLDGDGDGAGGDDYAATFTISPPAQNSLTLSIPDFVRGPGQPVNLPSDTTSGIPVQISNGTDVRTIGLQIDYDPELLTISTASVAEGMPTGAAVNANTDVPGRLVLEFSSPTPLSAGSQTIVNLQASVPEGDVAGNYGRQNLLDLHSVVIRDGNDNEFSTVADDAYHLVSYFGDVSGNGRINAADAAQVARVAALIDTGFRVSLMSDPQLVGDISGNQRINAADASRVARFAALLPVDEIPPLPSAAVADVGVPMRMRGGSPYEFPGPTESRRDGVAGGTVSAEFVRWGVLEFGRAHSDSIDAVLTEYFDSGDDDLERDPVSMPLEDLVTLGLDT